MALVDWHHRYREVLPEILQMILNQRWTRCWGQGEERLLRKHFLRQLLDGLIKLGAACRVGGSKRGAGQLVQLAHLSHPNGHPKTMSGKRCKCSPPQCCFSANEDENRLFSSAPDRLGWSLHRKWSQRVVWTAPGFKQRSLHFHKHHLLGRTTKSPLKTTSLTNQKMPRHHRVHAHHGTVDEATQRCSNLIPLAA